MSYSGKFRMEGGDWEVQDGGGGLYQKYSKYSSENRPRNYLSGSCAVSHASVGGNYIKAAKQKSLKVDVHRIVSHR